MQTKSTIGADFLSKEIEVDDQAVTLQIWDTAGQERFQGLGTTFYRGSDAAIFVFDVARKQTFDELENWRNAFLIQINQEVNNAFPMLIIGNKIDRPDRVVTTEMGRQFCDKHGVEYLECSAKDSINVEKAFEAIARNAISKINPENITFDEGVDLNANEGKKNDDCC
jgi:Ras-related protein Rab-7A